MNRAAKIYLFIFFAVAINSCNETITSNRDNTCSESEPMANFSYISKNIFDVTCARSGCHKGNDAQAGMRLTKEEAYQNLVNVGSWASGLKRVEPGNSSQSFIIKRLNGDGEKIMPPTGKLPQCLIDSIAAWIDNGAIND